MTLPKNRKRLLDKGEESLENRKKSQENRKEMQLIPMDLMQENRKAEMQLMTLLKNRLLEEEVENRKEMQLIPMDLTLEKRKAEMLLMTLLENRKGLLMSLRTVAVV